MLHALLVSDAEDRDHVASRHEVGDICQRYFDRMLKIAARVQTTAIVIAHISTG